MNKSLIYKVLVVLVFISSSSCKKWLDVKPQDGLIKQDYWKTKEQLESAVIGVYITLVDQNTVSQLFRWGELRADLVMNAPTPGKPSVDEVEFIAGNILPTNSIADWTHIYKVINNCNIIIDSAPLVVENDPTVTLADLNKSVAEAKAIRALLYFYLLRTYREVPLQLQGVSEDTQIVSLAKSSSEDIATQILADLKFAEEHAVETFKNNPDFDKGRITKYAVYAMQADVYLWLDRYAEADEACEKIIQSGKFRLVPGDQSFFEDLYVRGNSSETIFAFQYSTEKPNPFYNMFQLTSKSFVASPVGIEGIFPIDESDPTLQDLRSGGVSYQPLDMSIWKYNGETSTTLRAANQSIANYTIYRYADVLLMQAEALAWIPGNGDKVMERINRVRNRAGALESTKREPDLTSSSALAEYVFEERGREFAFEGKRWFDLLRYAKRNDYENRETLLSLGTTNVPSNLSQSVTIKLLDNNSHYLPVPFREIQANKNLIQNPFYQ